MNKTLSNRATAIVASAMLVALGPAGAPAFAAGQPGPSAWEPPPVDMGALAGLPAESAHGTPDAQFTLGQNSGCIRTGVGSVQLTDRPPAQDMMNIDTAHQFSTGQGVTVAEIDTGVNPHPFLTNGGRLQNGGDYILGDGNALIDCDGHGTIVAGIIAADTRGKGVAFTGVAPDAKILAIKHTSTHYTAQNPDGSTKTAGDLQTLAEAIRFAADQPQVKVITMSVDDCMLASAESLTLHSTEAMALEAAIHYAYTVKDKVVIAAAGNLPSQGNTTDQNGQQASACQGASQNSNPNPNVVNQVQVPPVYAGDVMSVASVDPTTGAPSPFTVWGPWVTIAAPGQGITSVDPGDGGTGLSNSTTENNQPVPLQGTSFAAPYVAGVVALVRSKYPDLSAQQVVARVEATAQHPSGVGQRNNQVGYGIIDPVAALTASIPGQNGVPVASSNPIKPLLPMAAVKDWTPFRVALIGTVVAVVLLLTTLFVVRTVRRRAERNA